MDCKRFLRFKSAGRSPAAARKGCPTFLARGPGRWTGPQARSLLERDRFRVNRAVISQPTRYGGCYRRAFRETFGFHHR